MNEGESTSVACFDGTWTRNHESSVETDTRKITEENELFIRNASVEDTGTYICEFNNFKHIVNVFVNGEWSY